MATYVSHFEREPHGPFYTITRCKKNSKQCEDSNTRYHLFVNEDTAQKYPYPATEDNRTMFVSKAAFEPEPSQTTKDYLEKQTCWRIDPCTPSVADYCCDAGFRDPGNPYTVAFGGGVSRPKQPAIAKETDQEEDAEEDKDADKNKLSDANVVLFFVILGVFLALMLGVAFMLSR